MGYRQKTKYKNDGTVDPHTSQKAGNLLFDDAGQVTTQRKMKADS